MEIVRGRVPTLEPMALPKREMSIERALEWAFRNECARLDFEGSDHGGGVGTEWVLMQRAIIGTQIDGGGRSAAADDAAIIASFVADLPINFGGKGMAAQIASLARAGMRPNSMAGVRVQCIPRSWGGKGGRFGSVAKATERWLFRSRRRGKVREAVKAVECEWVPVTYLPTQAQIDSARRNYREWTVALRYLRAQLVKAGLDRITLTAAMPPERPWLNAPISLLDTK